MADASNVQTSFLSGEWSPYAQGRLDDPEYKRGMNVCRNSHPIETGACTRRTGTRFMGFTRAGQPGKLIPFSFSQSAPYVMEFTEGKVRFFNALGLVMAEEPRIVTYVSGASPALVATGPGETWADGNTVIFDFPQRGAPPAAGLLIGRQFTIVMGVDNQHFAIYDAITGAAVDGAALAWATSVPIQVSRVFELDTPYINGTWKNLRGVQDEDSVLLLCPSIQPYSMFAPIDGGNLFTLSPAQFIDGPYLSPPTDGSFLTTDGVTGTINMVLSYPTWSNAITYPDGSRYFTSTQKRAGLTSTSTQYTAGAVVFRGGTYYVSIQDQNINHDPASSPTWWTPIAPGAIVNAIGFQQTDVGRSVRLFAEPPAWISTTDYSAGDLVKYQDAYYSALQATIGNIPGTDAVNWGVASNAAQWTWGIIISVSSPVEFAVSLQGADLLYDQDILTWRLGTYADSTSWPSCGTFHESRFWLGGAVKNAFDASKSDGNTYDFTPTAPDGTVSDDNGISETLASPQQNLLLWMQPDHQGIVMGTAQGEWLVQSSANNDPITPTSIQAHNVTKYGSANIEPRRAGVSLAFVQRQGKKLMEYVCDLFSSKFAALNLSERAKHLTGSGIAELAYQQELVPILWARCNDGSLIGTTYKRESMMVSQPPVFNGWHRHDLGSGFNVISIVGGASPNGLLDSITMITQDPADGVCRVESLTEFFDETSTALDAWFLDCGTAPLGGVDGPINGVQGVTFSGFAHLEGKTVSAYIAGLDLGDYTITDGAIFVPYQSDPDKKFTAAYLQSIDALDQNFGYQATQIQIPQLSLVPGQTMTQFLPTPANVGHFTYLNYGAQALCDWPRDRVTFLLPGASPFSGLVQYRISTGAFIKQVNIDEVFGTPISPYYDPATAYAANPTVLGSDSKIYTAIVPNSFNVDPTASGQKDWAAMTNPEPLPAQWASGTTYASGAYVLGGSDPTNIYRSLVSSNTGNQPATSPTDWEFFFAIPPVWNHATVYGSLVTVTGNDDEIFYTLQAVPAGQGDPNSFSRNNNPYWASQGSGYPWTITDAGLGMDHNGDIYMYEGGNFGPYVRIDGTTLTQRGFAAAVAGQSVPAPSGGVVPIRVVDSGSLVVADAVQEDYMLETVNTTPSGSSLPSAVIFSTSNMVASEINTVVFDEGNSPIACSGATGAGYGSAFVMTRPLNGNPSTTPLGLYEIDMYSASLQSAGVQQSAFRIDPNFNIFGNTPPQGPQKRKAGTFTPGEIDPDWTFFAGFTGLIYDQLDGNVMTFATSANPAAWLDTAGFNRDATTLSYTLGSDNNIYHFTDATAAWDGTHTYALNDLAYSDGFIYKSAQNGNINHAVSDASWWTVQVTEDPTMTNTQWTLVGPKATQFNYLVKLRTADATVMWAMPVASAPAGDIQLQNLNIMSGYYIFLESLGLGGWQGRAVETLTGINTVFTVGGLAALGANQTYNDAIASVILYPQYDSTQPNAPTPIGATPSTFTGWGKWVLGENAFVGERTYTTVTVPAAVGFTYTSQGQTLRPVAPAETGARNGPAFGKTRRNHRYAVSVANCSPAVQFGTDFNDVGDNSMRPARFKSRGGKGAQLLPSSTLYTGEHSDTIDDDYDLDGMLCWQVTRPVPVVVLALGGMLQTQDR